MCPLKGAEGHSVRRGILSYVCVCVLLVYC